MASTGIDYAKSRVILLGTSVYRDRRFPNVPAAEKSLRGMLSALADPRLGGWPPGRIEYWHNRTDAQAVTQRIRDIASSTEDVLVFYFVGHGTVASRSGELCLILQDTKKDHPDLFGLDFSLVRDALTASPASTKIVILDCCFSGRAIGNRLSAGDLAELSDTEGAYTLTACNRLQPLARWSDKGTPTSFTHELLRLIYQGMREHGATITLDDLYEPLRERLRSLDLPLPDCKGIDNGGRLPFTLNPAYGAALRGDALPSLEIPAPLRVELAPRLLARRITRRNALLAGGAVLLAGTGAGAAAVLWPRRPRLTELVGIPVGPAESMHNLQAWNVVTGRLNGQPIAVSSGGDGSIYTWDLTARKRIGTMQNGTPDNPPDLKHGVRGLALAYPDGPNGAPVVITGSDDKSVRVWSLADQRAIGQMPARHTDKVRAIATTVVAGQHLVISGSDDKTALVWDLTSTRLVGELPTMSQVHSIATGVLGTGTDSVPVAITGTENEGLQVWVLRSYHQTSQYRQFGPAMSAGSPVYAVAIGSVNGHPIAVTGDTANYVRFWNLETYEQINPPTRPQHSDWLWATAIGQLGGRTIAVSVGDATGRVWDLTSDDQQLIPLAQQENSVWGLALTEVAGTHYAVTACLSGQVRTWNLDPE